MRGTRKTHNDLFISYCDEAILAVIARNEKNHKQLFPANCDEAISYKDELIHLGIASFEWEIASVVPPSQ